MSVTENKVAALELAQKGFKVFPLHTALFDDKGAYCSCKKLGCESVGKHPRFKKYLDRATTDPAQIEKWWAEWPDANIGIATGEKSGVFVVDVDGPAGRASLHTLETLNSKLPDTLSVTTGRGDHRYYRYPGCKVKNSTSELAKSVDVRGNGGYVIGPPSIHSSGKHYEWLDAETPIAEAPDWLIAKVSTGEVSEEGKVEEGEREKKLFAKVCELFKTCKTKEEILEAALEFNKNKLSKPLNVSEVRSKVAAISKTHKPNLASERPTRSERNPLYWFEFDVHSFLADQHVLTDYQQGWRTRLQAFAWQSEGYLLNDLAALFALSRASSKKKFMAEMHLALYDFEKVTKDGKSYLVSHSLAGHYTDKMAGWTQKREAGRARAQAKATAAKTVELPTESKREEVAA